jgi:hypothetical protein
MKILLDMNLSPSWVRFLVPDAIGRDVVRVLTMRAQAISEGAIVTIDKFKSRVRVLPIRRTPDDIGGV